MSLIGNVIAPYRLYAEIALAVIAISAATLWWHEHNVKEQGIGAAKCEAADAKVVQQQVEHNAEVHTEETKAVTREAETYHEATTTPVTGAPLIRVCQSTKSPTRGSVPGASSAGLVDHGEAELPKPNTGMPAAVEWNSEPVVRAGRDADAQVMALQDYIQNVCVRQR